MEQFRKSQAQVNKDMMSEIMKQMYGHKSDFKYEHSELLLYQNQVLCEAGEEEAALEHLEAWGEEVVDRERREEVRGRLQLSLGRREQARQTYEELIRKNPDNVEYYRALVQCREEGREEVLRLYCSLHPRALAPRLLLLEELSGEGFIEEVTKYLEEGVRRGVPSLLESLASLYTDPDKAAGIGKVLEKLRTCLEREGRFQEEGEERERPSCLLWTLNLLSLHHSRLGQYQEALECSDQALAHTPTLVELYMARAELHAAQGDPLLAAQWMEEAQGLDTADRAVACEAARFLLRAGRVEDAVAVMGLHTKPGEPVLDYLKETQCSWFLLEMARAHLARGERGLALVRCAELRDIFVEVEEDQLDFHLFAMARMRLRHYVDLLRFEDRLRTFGVFSEAGQLAIGIYLEVHDRRLGGGAGGAATGSEQSDSEARKQRNKAKKAARKEQEMRSQKQGKTRVEKVEAECLTPQKVTYSAQELESVADPLEEALKYLAPLQEVLGEKLTTHTAAFEVALRREKPLQMLRALRGAERAAPGSLEVARMEARLVDWREINTCGGVVGRVLAAGGLKSQGGAAQTE